MPDPTQHSLPEVPVTAAELLAKSRHERVRMHTGERPWSELSEPVTRTPVCQAADDLADALPSLHAAWEKERGAKLRKAAEDVLEFEAQIERRGDASAMEDYEGAINDLRAALEIR